MKVTKFSYALLSALMLAGAVAPSVTTFASEAPVSDSVKVESSVESILANSDSSTIPTGPDEYTSSPELDALTQYVSVVNNQWVLSVPNDAGFSDDLITQAQAQIKSSNAFVTAESLEIDPETMVATKELSIRVDGSVEERSYGVNGLIKTGWNYQRWAFDAGLVKDLMTGSVAAVFGGIGWAVSGPVGAMVVAAIAAIVGNHLPDIKDGVWVDYNTILKTVTNVGFQ